MPQIMPAVFSTSKSFVHLVEIILDTITLRRSSSSIDISSSGNTYTGGQWRQIPSFTKQLSPSESPVSIKLSGVTSTNISQVIGNEYINRRVNVYIAASDDYNQIMTVFSGVIKSIKFSENVNRSANIVSIDCVSPLYQLRDNIGRLASDSVQQSLSPGDKFFEFIPDLIDKTNAGQGRS